MSEKRSITNKEARELDRKDLMEILGGCFPGETGLWLKASLANAAEMIREGQVSFNDAAQAIKDGWNPAEAALQDFLLEKKLSNRKQNAQEAKGREVRFKLGFPIPDGPAWAAFNSDGKSIVEVSAQPDFSHDDDNRDIEKLRQKHREKCQRLTAHLSSLGAVVAGRVVDNRFICKKSDIAVAINTKKD